MNPREIIILVLGLAIVAVILRGLYLALRARRGQIKLAIDKNIPQDIDLEALELAELPGGGARVVERTVDPGNPETNRLDEAEQRAAALNLGKPDSDDDVIPVLMDAVKVNNEFQSETSAPTIDSEPEPEPEPEQSYQSATVNWAEKEPVDAEIGYEPPIEASGEGAVPSDNELDATEAQESSDSAGSGSDSKLETGEVFSEDFSSTAPALGAGLSEPFVEQHDTTVSIQTEAQGAEIPEIEPEQQQKLVEQEQEDDLLLDYGPNHYEQDSELDPLAQLAPDYPEEPGEIATADEDFSEQEARYDPPISPISEEEAALGEESELEEEPDEEVELQLEEDSSSADEQGMTQPAVQSFEDQLEDFSMSAGERIGYDPEEKPAAPIQSLQARTENSKSTETSEKKSAVEATEVPASDPSLNETKQESRIKRSFFSVFKRKPKNELETETVIEEVEQVEEVELIEVEETTAEPQSTTEIDSLGADSQLEVPLAQPVDSEPTITNDVSADETIPSLVESKALDSLESYEQQTAMDEESDSQPAVTEPSEVLVINVMASEGYAFRGDDLMQVLLNSGLKFGEMNIFHHHLRGHAKGPVLFSVANVLNPGTFDLNNMNDFTTMGVSFFLALPTSIRNMDAFETMLSVAQQVKDGLGAELRDDQRNLMTAQTIEHYRQRVRDFELRQLKAGIRQN
ncbi:MAG: cell division protein ZipA [Pseudohongiellaceae bacterium]